METDYLPDSTELALEGDFNTQMDKLLKQIRLTRQQVEGLEHLFRNLEELLQYQWPGCSVKPFGSIITGLGIISSDVDCYVQLPEYNPPTDRTVIEARNRLRSNPQLFTELFAITKAKVPILKTFHRPTGYHCDINFTSMSGIYNSRLIAHLLHMDPRAIKIAVVVKYWSKVHKITGTNLMPNYALTMLVIFFLQQKSMVPSVSALQKNIEPLIIENWNASFDCNYLHKMTNNESIYNLLGEFFKYYANFNFDEHLICPYLGYPIQKKCFDLFRKNFSLYQYNLDNALCKPLRLDSLICIQDPFEHSRNCSVGVYYKLAMKIIGLFKSAAEAYTNDENDNFLNEILLRSEDSVEPISQYKKTKLSHNKVQKRQLHRNVNGNQHNFKNFNRNQNNYNKGKFTRRGKR